jgi:hypothetical protein
MKGAETGFEIVPLGELPGKKVPVKQNKPVKRGRRRYPGQRPRQQTCQYLTLPNRRP